MGSNNPTLRTFNAYPLTDRRRGRGGSSSTRRSYMANHVQYYDLLLSFRDWSVEHHGLNSKDWSTMSWQTSPVAPQWMGKKKKGTLQKSGRSTRQKWVLGMGRPRVVMGLQKIEMGFTPAASHPSDALVFKLFCLYYGGYCAVGCGIPI